MRRFHILILTALSLAVAAHAQEVQGKPELIRSSLDPDARQLVGVITRAVSNSGGDLGKQNIHLVMAFSTGHYKTDPIGAQAAREVATQVVTDLTVPGDQVSSRAWEMDVWSNRDPATLTLKIGNDKAADQARAAALWPTTPEVGSIGGHDTERAAVTLGKEFANDAGTVLVMITNTAASVGAEGTRLIGANAPEYLDLLQHWNRVPGTQDGATLDLPYLVHSPTGDVKGEMQAVVFAPKTFTAAPLAKPRSELLRVAATPAARTSPGAGAAGVVIGLLVLAGLGYLGYRLLAGGGAGRGSLRVADQEFSLRDVPKGRPFCLLAGAGYSSDGAVPLVLIQGLPPEPLAELSVSGQELRVRSVGEVITLDTVGGRVPTGPHSTVRLRADTPDTELEFSGEVRGAGGVPRAARKTVTISFQQGT